MVFDCSYSVFDCSYSVLPLDEEAEMDTPGDQSETQENEVISYSL